MNYNSGELRLKARISNVRKSEPAINSGIPNNNTTRNPLLIKSQKLLMLINLNNTKQMCYNVVVITHFYYVYLLLDLKQIKAEASADRDYKNSSLVFFLSECWKFPNQSYKVYLTTLHGMQRKT